MGAPRITEPQKEHYLKLRQIGLSLRRAAAQAKVSEGWAKGFERNLRNSSGDAWKQSRDESKLPGPIPFDELGDNARRGLEDFEFFRFHYLGHVSVPWQIEVAEQVVKLLVTPEREYVLENGPPGAGKTTLKHDIAAWLTCQNRRIRGAIGSRVERNSERMVLRVKRTLSRTVPPKAKQRDKELGLAVDAAGCLAVDYGLFKPSTREVWQAGQFVVAQMDDEAIEDKEPTWSAYGMDSGVLSNRWDLIIWDDVVDRQTVRNPDIAAEQRQWWDDEAETRLEPGGVLFLSGQRMGAGDLYAYVKSKRVELDDDDRGADDDPGPFEADERPTQYRVMVYRAHYDDRCQGDPTHGKDAPPYPEGCLLDPKRLPWKGREGLRALAQAKPQTYRIQYQQEDVNPDQVLAHEAWIWGGVDPNGFLAPGCVDEWRDLCRLPPTLAGPKISTATVDPSGKKMWAIQWWIDTPEADDQTWLMDLERRAIPANELLDWDAVTETFTGIMEDWQVRSIALGLPITTWIVEDNAAQRYLLAYQHVRRWMRHHGVAIMPHTTGPRKLDEDYGPWIMRDRFRQGRIRLPGALAPSRARVQTMKLVVEVTKWPSPGVTDDEVMAAWFLHRHRPTLQRQVERKPLVFKRPSWVSDPHHPARPAPPVGMRSL